MSDIRQPLKTVWEAIFYSSFFILFTIGSLLSAKGVEGAFGRFTGYALISISIYFILWNKRFKKSKEYKKAYGDKHNYFISFCQVIGLFFLVFFWSAGLIPIGYTRTQAFVVGIIFLFVVPTFHKLYKRYHKVRENTL